MISYLCCRETSSREPSKGLQGLQDCILASSKKENAVSIKENRDLPKSAKKKSITFLCLMSQLKYLQRHF